METLTHSLCMTRSYINCVVFTFVNLTLALDSFGKVSDLKMPPVTLYKSFDNRSVCEKALVASYNLYTCTYHSTGTSLASEASLVRHFRLCWWTSKVESGGGITTALMGFHQSILEPLHQMMWNAFLVFCGRWSGRISPIRR